MEESTRIHPETGEILHRDIRPIEFEYKGEKIMLDMPGWYPPEGDNGIFTMDDMEVHDKALKILRAQYEKSLQKNDFQIKNAALA